MSHHHGIHVLGAAIGPMRGPQRVSRIYDQIDSPRVVIANSAQVGKSVRMDGGIARVVVSGGKRRLGYLDPDTVMYEAPASVTVYPVGAKPRTVTGLQALMVIAGNRSLDIIAGDVAVGAIDIGSKTKELNALKPVTISVARIMLRGGQAAINSAINIGNTKKLPGSTSRENVKWKLDWHSRDDGGGLAKSLDPNAIYAYADDLKKWVIQAFIEDNAVEEGAVFLDQAWSKMWSDMAANIASLPKDVRDKASEGVEWITGVPTWGWAIGGAAVLGLLGYAVFGVAKAAAPGIAGAYMMRPYR